jgi:hypothetical protein
MSRAIGAGPDFWLPMRHLALRLRGRAIDVAVAERDRAPLAWTIPNRPASIRRLVKLVGTGSELRACCEEGPLGYALYWQLAALGVACDLVPPTSADIADLAAAHCAERLTFVWSPAAALAALQRIAGIAANARV